MSIWSNYYSVPYKQIWNYVDVKIWKNLIKIYDVKTNGIVAVHNKLIDKKWEYCTKQSHYPDYKRQDLQTEYQFNQLSKMKDIWEYAYRHSLKIKEVNPDNWYRSVKWILSLQKKYWNEVLDLSCKRALAYEVYTYQVILNMCQNWYYKEELPDYLNEHNSNDKNKTGKLVRSLSYYAQTLFYNL